MGACQTEQAQTDSSKTPIRLNFSARWATSSPGESERSSQSESRRAVRRFAAVSSQFRCAPPTGSGTTPSMTPRLFSSGAVTRDRKSTRLNSSHLVISYAVFCLKKKINKTPPCFRAVDQTATQKFTATLTCVHSAQRLRFVHPSHVLVHDDVEHTLLSMV